MISDYELGILNSLGKMKITSQGCYFHFTQSIFRRIMKNGLEDKYKSNKMFRFSVKLLMLTPLFREKEVLKIIKFTKYLNRKQEDKETTEDEMSEEDEQETTEEQNENSDDYETEMSEEDNDNSEQIIKAIEEEQEFMVENIDDIEEIDNNSIEEYWKEIIDYFNDQWMSRIKHEIWSVNGKEDRTNNISESLNSELIRFIKTKKPSFNVFLTKLHDFIEMKEEQVNEKLNRPKRITKKDTNIELINTFINNYYDDECLSLSFEELLSKIYRTMFENVLEEQDFEISEDCEEEDNNADSDEADLEYCQV